MTLHYRSFGNHFQQSRVMIEIQLTLQIRCAYMLRMIGSKIIQQIIHKAFVFYLPVYFCCFLPEGSNLYLPDYIPHKIKLR